MNSVYHPIVQRVENPSVLEAGTSKISPVIGRRLWSLTLKHVRILHGYYTCFINKVFSLLLISKHIVTVKSQRSVVREISCDGGWRCVTSSPTLLLQGCHRDLPQRP